jgi:hypothetical protein
MLLLAVLLQESHQQQLMPVQQPQQLVQLLLRVLLLQPAWYTADVDVGSMKASPELQQR